MHFLVFAEILVHLKSLLASINTYHAFSHSWWKSHLVTGLSLVEKVCSSSKKAENRVEETLHSILRLLRDCKEQVVNLISTHNNDNLIIHYWLLAN